MPLKHLIISITITCLLLIYNANATRDVSHLTTRLEAGGGLVECWNALLEIKSCADEIVRFFVDGQTSLGHDCCRAVGFITHKCWPAMLTSLGLTAEEGDLLRGYCDSLASPASGPAPAGGGSTASALVRA